MKKKIAELINIVFGFRKFILMIFILLVGILFRLHGLISGSEMVDLLKATTIGFFSANGVEHIVQGITTVMGKGSPAAASQVADTDTSNDNEEVEPVVEG